MMTQRISCETRVAGHGIRLLLAILFTLMLHGAFAQTSLVNGGGVTGAITFTGEQQSFSFFANDGDGVLIRVHDLSGTDFRPRARLFRPDNFNVASPAAETVAGINYGVTVTGVHTLVVSDSSLMGDQTGAFEIQFTRAPGANEGGAFPNGIEIFRDLDVGDLDSFTFDANDGDGIEIRVADLSAGAMIPQIHLYRPDGFRVLAPSGDDVASFFYSATQTGTHTVVISDNSANLDQSGAYVLHFTRSPGANADGVLTNGEGHPGVIDLGDLDSFTFEAEQGDGVQLRLADLSGGDFVPGFSLHRPDGFRVLAPSGSDVAGAVYTVTQTGTHTVVVSDNSALNNQTGSYNLYYAKAPGANENGPLTNGGLNIGDIELGDIDSYTFEAQPGDGVQIRLADIDGGAFRPRMTLYRPDGVSVLSPSAEDVAAINYAVTEAGTHTLMITDNSPGLSETGNYTVNFTLAPGANEFGSLENGDLITGILGLGDLDSYTFSAIAGEVVSVSATDLGGGGLAPRLWLYRPDGTLVLSPSNEDVAMLNYAVTQTGVHTLVLSDNSVGLNQTGSYTLEFLVDVEVPDGDDDLVPDAIDNCLLISNADQRDTDGDGYGNACDPDLDNNGVVNFSDIALFVPEFGTVSSGDADFNGDGLINFVDYALLAGFFLLPPGPSALVP